MHDPEFTFEDCTFIESETVVAGNKSYETDALDVPVPITGVEDDSRRVNHIDHECPNCAAIDELAIELRTESAYCPICDHRRKLTANDVVVKGTYIDDQPAE